LSRTTWPISTKLGGKHAWGMGIQICSNKVAGPFWGPIRTTGQNALILGMEHPWGKEIQVCSNEVPGSQRGPKGT